MKCPECGIGNTDQARFCNQCGTRLTAVEQEDERRQLTVLFADLVDSTRHAASLDPEDWSEAVQRYQSICQRSVTRYDGHIAQYLGDGVLVYFGYPVTHEDSAARALYCALAIRGGLSEINPEILEELGFRLQIRIGIHTGPVVVGKMGVGAKSETLALGNTPNIAARLQALAPADGIAASQVTVDLAGPAFVATDIGKQNLKGLDEPLSTFLLDGFTTRTDPGAHGQFVGRERELASLEGIWDEVFAGSTRSVLISGEPGIGKSSLTRAFRAGLGESDHYWCALNCSTFEARAPFASIIEGLKQRFESAEMIRTGMLDELEPRVQAAVRDFLDLPAPTQMPVIGSQIEKRELFIAGVVGLLAAAARRRPLVVCVEDVHWVDPSSLETLHKLLELRDPVPLLLLMTARQEPEHAFQDLHRIALEALPAEEIAVLMAGLLEQHQSAIVSELARRSDGIPLFAEELAKSFTENSNQSTDEVPVSLRDLLRAQLDGLGVVRQTAQAAAILGRDFSRELLLRVTRVESDEAERHIERLLTERIFVDAESERLEFRHALIQEEAYSSMLRRERRRYHAEAADILADEFTDTPPHALARHRSAAAQPDLAVRLWYQAANDAKSVFAHQEALTHIRSGIDELERLSDATEKARWEIRLQLGLGQTISMLRSFYDDEVREAYRRAREISSDIQDRESLFESLATLQGASVTRERIEHSQELAAQLRDVAATMSRQHQLTANVLSGMTDYAAGKIQDAIQWFRPITDLLESDQTQSLAGPLSGLSDAYLAPAYWMSGHPELAGIQATVALGRAQSSTIPFSEATVLNCAAQVHTLRGEYEQALTLAHELKRLAEEHEHHQHSLTARYLEAAALGFSEDSASGLAMLLDLNEQTHFEGLDGYFSWFQVDIGDLLIRAGRTDEALAVIKRAITVLGEFGGGTNLPGLLNQQAIAVASRDESGAETLWREALALADNGGAYGWSKLILDSYGPFLRARNRTDEADRLGSEIDVALREHDVVSDTGRHS